MRVLIFLLLLPFSAFANNQLITQFLSHEGIDNKSDVYTGEMLARYSNQPTIGERLPKDAETILRVLEKTADSEIYALQILKDGKSQDRYIFLKKEQNKWKISAVRSLALPNFFYTLVQHMKNTNRTPEQEHQYQNMLLMLQPDSQLKQFLIENVDTLNAIASESKKNRKKATNMAKSLNLNDVRYEPSSSIVDVSIGGILDNSVGYMYVPDGSSAPSMSSIEYIYIEHVVGNWYVYKTT